MMMNFDILNRCPLESTFFVNFSSKVTVYKQDSETLFFKLTSDCAVVFHWWVATIISVQLRENRKLKYALTFGVIG